MRMTVVRYDIVGTIGMKLVSRPTNTAEGVSNFHIYADGFQGGFPAPIVRFLGTDADAAHERYFDAVRAAQDVYRAHPP